MTVVPYKDEQEGKKAQIAKMFNNVSKRYDFLNHLLTLGIDKLWRKKAVNLLKKENPQMILDIATGTGDFAIELSRLNPEKVIGVDISEGMLEVGRVKIKKLKLDHKIEMQLGDSEKLLFKDNTFDAVTAAFGVRNFEDLHKGLSDMHKVLKNGGSLVILELSKPKTFPLKQIFNLYFRYILPQIGKLVSKDQSAYTYLPESVQAFPDGNDFLNILKKIGFKETRCIPLSFGISSIYFAKK